MTSIGSADIYALSAALQESAGGAEVNTQNVLLHSANYLKSDMEARVPVRTGRLRQSIQVRVHGHQIVVGPDTEYAAFVEFGTKPHVIRAKPGKKALAFKVAGQTVIVKSVNHPGTKPNPFVRPAFEDWVDTLGGLVAEAHIKRFNQKAA